MATDILESREVLTTRLQRQLATLVASVELTNRNNPSSTSVVLENILAGLLNRVYDWNLINANTIQQDLPGVELIDAKTNIAVHITATRTVEKVRHTLEEAGKSGIVFERLIILIITNTPPTKGMRACTVPTYPGPIEIWNIPDVFRAASALETKKLDDLTKFMEAEIVALDSRPRAMLDNIQRALIEYAEKVKLLTASGRTDIVMDAEHIFRDLLNEMFGYNLTNANQISSNFPAVDLIDEKHGVAVQITSTNAKQKAQRTLNIFLHYDLEKNYPTLVFLILAFTPPFRNADQLIHRTREQGVDLRIMTLMDLYYEIERMPSGKINAIAECLDKHIGLAKSVEDETGVDLEAPSTTPYELSDICQQVFCLASMLPSEGLRRTVFEHGLSLEQKKAVDDLIDCKLLQEKVNVLQIYPFYRQNIDFIPSPTECNIFLDQLWNYERSWQWDKVLWRDRNAVSRSLAQIFATAADSFPEFSAFYAHRSAELWQSTQHYRDALQQEQTVLASLESDNKESWDVARARHFTGECHSALQEHDLARKDWEITLKLCQNPLRASAPDLAVAFHNVGKALLELQEYESAETSLLSALKLIEDLRKNVDHFSSQSWCTEIYESLATLYDALDRRTTAIMCKENAQRSPDTQERLWEKLYAERHIHLENLPLRSALGKNAFVGREAELAEIRRRFETDRIVALSGLGGTGKTELAIRYGTEHEAAGKGLVYFVRFRGDFYQTVVNEISRGIPNYKRRGKSEQQIYNETMAALWRCWKNDLLILDNVHQANFSMLRRELSSLPLQILITTRHDIPNAIPVKAMDQEKLYTIFRQHGVDIPLEEMDILIDAVNGHTLTIDLIARTMSQSRRTVTTEQLLTALQRYKTTDGFAKVSTDYEGSLERVQIYNHLKTVFQVAYLSELELRLLRCATLLPSEGIDAKLFLESFAEPDTLGDVLDDLIVRGWLSMEGGLLRIHPIIRIVCIETLKPTDKTCDAFLEGVRKQYDPNHYDHIQLTQMASLFTEASTVLEDWNGYWANAAGHLWNELSEPQKALDCNLRSVEKSEMYQPNSINLASAYNNVGYTYGILSNHEKALEYKLKALSIREMEFPVDHPDLAQSYDNVGSTYGDLGDHEKAWEYKLKALSIREQVLPSDHPDLAQSYDNLGSTYGDLGDHEKAQKYNLKAMSIWEHVLPSDHPILAQSYDSVGTTYRTLGDYQKALEYQLKALAIREKVLPPEHPVVAYSYNSIGSIYIDLGDYHKALEYGMKALSILENTLPENHPDIAYSCLNVAHSYGYLGAYSSALAYSKRALEIAETTLPPKHPDLKNIRRDADQYQAMKNMLAHMGEVGNTDDSKLSRFLKRNH